MMKLYVEVFASKNGLFYVPAETYVVLFALKFCNATDISLVLVFSVETNEAQFGVDLANLTFSHLPSTKIPSPAHLCKLPAIVMNEDSTCAAGICAVIRHIFKSVDVMHPFLGFKQNCLYACAESSIWTKFCEVDMMDTVKNVRNNFQRVDFKEIPLDVARFEIHLSQPVRIHNIQKVKQDKVRAMNSSLQTTEISDLDHVYAEGPYPSLADIILLSYFHALLQYFGPGLRSSVPRTLQWYERMLEIENISFSLDLLHIHPPEPFQYPENYTLPNVQFKSLYKSDPKRYKPRHRIFTKQADIDASILAVESIELDMLQFDTFGFDVPFDWTSVPWDAQPEGGSLPNKRVERKSQQLENLARAVLKVAQPGDRIVDFCAGSGHLGLILAHCLPRCTIILLENKEESLSRARERATKLHLSNIVFCQSNVDYFIGEFEVGASLHACGVATDLVIDQCIRREASFVCCPCCYGSLQPNHVVCYPRSQRMKMLPLSEREYLVLGHAADQTHDEANSKTVQGQNCMNMIDADRCFNAREAGYWVSLSKLYPPSCTPKNNLLVGLAPLAAARKCVS